MPDAKEIQNFLDKVRYAPGVLSSNCILECALRNGKLSKGGTTDRLIGETFFRHWLFKGQLPDPLKKLFEHEELEEERTLLLEQKWEEQNELSPSFTYLKDRIDTFEKAEGIIALVNTEDKEALPIPFTFGSSQSRPGVWDDSSHSPQEIGAWSEYQEKIDSLLGSGITSVKLNVPLGPFAQMVEGRSLMLALALAVARREDPTLPPPLEVLATGSIIDGKIGPVEHMNEKMMLAKRIQARIVAVLKKPPAHSFASSENENLSNFLSRWQARFGKVLPAMLESHFESWHTHINNFRGRDKLVNQILDRLKDKDNGGHVALIMPEGMGKSALLTHVSEVLSKEARKSGKYQGSREICPWLPGCLLHMGKFGSDPHRVVESLLTQANSMLTNPVSIPDEPVREAPKRLDNKEGSNPKSPDYREIYRTHREALSQALGKLIEEKKQIFLLIDALDEITVDKGFLCIFPDPFPVGVRVMITGRNCQQVDSFMDRRSGFERIVPQKLEREEIPAITGVPEDSEDAKQFNDKVHQKTGGWTYAVKETEKRIKQKSGVFSDDLICNREETLNRMAEAWKGELLEDALEFLVLDELFNSLFEDSTLPGYVKSDLSSGNYEDTFYRYSPGPRVADLFSYLKFKNHKLKNSRDLRSKLEVIREQIHFFTGQREDYDHSKETHAENCLSFALRSFPEFCLEKFLAEDIDEIITSICNWMVKSRDAYLLWRVDFLIHKIKSYLEPSDFKSYFKAQHKKIGIDCWSNICKLWPAERIAEVYISDPFPCWTSLYEVAAHESLKMGDNTHRVEIALSAMGCCGGDQPYWQDPLYSNLIEPTDGINLLEEIIEEKTQESGLACYLLGCFYLGIDGKAVIQFQGSLVSIQKANDDEGPQDSKQIAAHQLRDEFKGLGYLESAIEHGFSLSKLILSNFYIDEEVSFYNEAKAIGLLKELINEEPTHIRLKSYPEINNIPYKLIALEDLVNLSSDSDEKIKYIKESINLGNYQMAHQYISICWKAFLKTGTKEPKNLALELISSWLNCDAVSRVNNPTINNYNHRNSDGLNCKLLGYENRPDNKNYLKTNDLSLFLEAAFRGKGLSFNELIFEGLNEWGYSTDKAVREFPDNRSTLPNCLSLHNDQIQILNDSFYRLDLKRHERKVRKMGDKGFFRKHACICFLNVSGTIRGREAGNEYRSRVQKLDPDLVNLVKNWFENNRDNDNEKVTWAKDFLELHAGPKTHSKKDLNALKEFFKSKYIVEMDLNKKIRQWFSVNGPVAVLPTIDWLEWEENPQDSNWLEADEHISSLAESGFIFDDTRDLVPWHNPSDFYEEESAKNPDYNWMAREGHPLYDLSVGMLARHSIYKDPDGLSPKQRFDLTRKGGIQVPEWMDDPLSQKK